MKILVLDDHDGLRLEIAGILERNGHVADNTGSADDAIPLVEDGKYDFVLVDYSMPGHDGLWFMEHVKKPRHTKFIMMTAQENIYIALYMIRAGGHGYIIKPFDEKSLLHHLNFYANDTELSLMASGSRG